jgi:phospholipid/cholesterol/gamma-HCH transport system substrate-binding protein
MENRSHALAAGVFMLILGLATVTAVWWLGQRREAVDYYLLETRGNVTGLNAQAPVRYRGIRAGRVEDITTDDRDPRLILVRISLASRFHLTRGTVAQLNTQGITGLAYVQLEDDGKNPEVLAGVDDEPPRIRLEASLLEQLGAQAGDIAVQAGELAIRLSRLLDDKNLRNFSRSLDNLAAASEGLKDLPIAMASLRGALSDANVRRLSTTLAGLEQTVGEAAPLARELREMVKTVTTLATRLNGLATATGSELSETTLPGINALTQELAVASRDLARLLELLERNPQSLVFGRGSVVPPGPGEAGFAPAKQ